MEYKSTLEALKLILRYCEDVSLTLDRQMKFDEDVKFYVEALIDTIEEGGTE